MVKKERCSFFEKASGYGLARGHFEFRGVAGFASWLVAPVLLPL
jgi:hypothetical protein